MKRVRDIKKKMIGLSMNFVLWVKGAKWGYIGEKSMYMSWVRSLTMCFLWDRFVNLYQRKRVGEAEGGNMKSES